MRPTPTLKAIANGSRRGLEAGGLGGDIFPTMATFFLQRGASIQENEAGEAGEAFDDYQKAKVLESFATHSPMGFVFSLAQIIEDNILRFDDEDVLEEAVMRCFEQMWTASSAAEILICFSEPPKNLEHAGFTEETSQ